MKMQRFCFWAGFLMAAVAGAIDVSGGAFFADFNDNAQPAGTLMFGNTVIEDGVLKLTKNMNSQQSSFIIDDLDFGDEVNGVEAQFRVRVGGGTATPADGFSFNFSDDLPDASFGEEGAGTGLTVVFDIYDNGGGEAPAIDLKWFGGVVATTPVPIGQLRTGDSFVDVYIRLEGDGTVDVTYNGQVIYDNFYLGDYFTFVWARTGFGARTGGLNENQWIDDITLTTTVGPVLIGFVNEPQDTLGLVGSQARFHATVTNPFDVVEYRWQRKGPGAANFADIPGAFDPTYQTPVLTLADEGTQYRVEVVGVQNTIVSDPATLSVVDLPVPPPQKVFDFDTGTVPAGTAVYGSAFVDAVSGVGGSGGLVLTIADVSQNGSFIVADFVGGKAVDGFAATFQAYVGGGLETPADGFSFSFGSDIPEGVFAMGEEGAGTGLNVCFDTYDNGGGEAPAIDIKWRGAVVASAKVTRDFLRTEPDFVDVLIRLEQDGTVDVAYDGTVVHHNVALPAFTALGNVKFALAGRTGGLFDDHLADNLAISTQLYAGGLEIIADPVDVFQMPGDQATFWITVNDPAQAAVQWQVKRPGDTDFNDIAGAQDFTYTTPPVAVLDNGTLFRAVAEGTFNTVTSGEATLNVLDLARPASPELLFDFNDGAVPAGTAIYGTSFVDFWGGIGDSGVLKLTTNANSLNGSFIVGDPNGGVAVEGFTVAMDVRVGGGSDVPADGFSFSFADDLPDGVFALGEEGAGNGLRVSFDIYDNGGGEAPAIDIFWGGALVVANPLPIDVLRTGDEFAEVLIRLNPDGTLDLAYDGLVIYFHEPIPGYDPLAPVAGGRFALAGRTGGLNENQWVDNLAIDTALYSGPTYIVEEPADRFVLPGLQTTLSVVANDPVRNTFQWFVKAPGAATFQEVPGAVGSSIVTPPMDFAASGTQYQVRVQGATDTVLSRAATITVVTVEVGDVLVTYNFDDGLVPVGTAVHGSTYVEGFGGVGNSGALVLTLPINDQMGSFIIDDLANGAMVYGFGVAFKARLCCGTAVPADGYSLVFGDDIGDGGFGETGTGTGLIISFDTYDNGGGEAPAIDVIYDNVVIATTPVPIGLLRTDVDVFADVIVRLRNTGVLDLVYDNEVIYYGLPIPGFAGMAGGRFALGGRTGGLNEEQVVDNLEIALELEPPMEEPEVSIARDGLNVIVTFTGVLQATPDLNQPFADVPGAVSPYTEVGAGSKFFRSRTP